MNRHFWRACDRKSGFTFVELLVTIIIAGIAFMAIVPLFVQAQKQNSADNARNVSLQLAQDRLEKIRQLDYDQINTTNLNSSTYAGGQFGTHWDFTRNGVSKTYTIQYTVTPVPSTAAAGQEQYKKVEVRVTWAAPPSPVKAAVLQALVYRQFAGPQITTVNVGPPGIFSTNPVDVQTIIGSPVVIDAYLNASDISSMDASNPDPAKRGMVTFSISSFTGVSMATQQVNAVYNGEAGHYQYSWDASTALDGIYRIEVSAMSAGHMQGGTAALSYNVALLNPPAPSGLVANAGDKLVTLQWNQSAIGDLDHYEVWKGTASGAEVFLTNVSKDSASLSDTAVANGTTYFYYVVVVDTGGNKSSPSAQVSAKPAVQTDIVAPSVPTALTAVKAPGAGAINLSWGASTDYGTPPTGVLGYVIERSPNGTTGWVQLQGEYPNLTYPDSSAGWSSTWYYRVAAKDKALNVSAFTARVGPVTTDAQPKYSLTVNNTQGVSIYIWVQNVGTGLWYATNGTSVAAKPAGSTIKKNKTDIWSNLPAGVYNVYASTSTSGSPLLTSKGGSGDVSAGNGSISF